MEGEVLSAFRETITIDAPPQVVWQLVTDIRRHPEFAGPKSITKLIDFDGELAVGGRWLAHERGGPAKIRRAIADLRHRTASAGRKPTPASVPYSAIDEIGTLAPAIMKVSCRPLLAWM